MTAPIVPQAVGEEFREDVRKKLPPEELAPLTRLDPLRSTIAVAQTYVLLALVIGFAIAFWSWWAAAIAVVLIAPLQHALFVLAHDGAHYRLYETRWLNDAVGRLCGTIAGVSMCTYRVIHRLHHNHLYGPQDPDIALHGGYPRGKSYLARKLAKDLAGLTAFKTFSYFFGLPSTNTATNKAERPLDDTSARLRQPRGATAGPCSASTSARRSSRSRPAGAGSTSCCGCCRGSPFCRRSCGCARSASTAR